MFRSEEMSHFSLYLPSDSAKSCVAELGYMGVIHFRDTNESKAFEKTFSSDIKHLEEVLRKCRWMEAHLSIELDDLLEIPTNLKISDVESKIGELEQRMVALVQSRDTMEAQMINRTQHVHVLEHFGHLTSNERYSILAGNETDVTTKVIAGAISREKMLALERILWKTLRGNLYMSSADIDISTETSSEHKSVFICYAHGAAMESKIRRICASLGSQLYPIEMESSKRFKQLESLNNQLRDIQHVLQTAKQALASESVKLLTVLPQYKASILMELRIYHVLNKFNSDGKSFVAQGWCPTDALAAVQRVLKAVSDQNGSSVSPILTISPIQLEPPTWHKTNKFTKCFQDIIDAYGIAKYQEVNPGLFTIISFPFLFAVMFGDFGHGILGTLLAIYLCYNEVKLQPIAERSEMFNMIFAGRYIMLLMFMFSIFTGLVYNDAFSKAVYFAESKFVPVEVIQGGKTFTQWNPIPDYFYPFGVDHIWNMAENKLLFLNSYKMKMSVIMGIVQMTLGIILTIFNYIHYKNYSSILLEFLPQIVFLHSIFGYLVVMIFAKWGVQWLDSDGQLIPGRQPPEILNMLIKMFISVGTVDDPFYEGQATLQVILILVALVCVPVMLLGKPLLLKRQHERKLALGYGIVPSRSNSMSTDDLKSPTSVEKVEEHAEIEEHEVFDFSEIMIHQIIHTIEFCLGAVSNTASYLRLWALSLAHARI
eukprot:NODE_361_length_10144_cov_0.288402.p3 type:complete len:711 gc:universal NODE_361_length_10144_cov_0.288402:605-2737(+)